MTRPAIDGRHVGQLELPGAVRLLDGWGAWLDSDMQGGSVDELLEVAAVSGPRSAPGRSRQHPERSGQSSLTGDHREERHLHTVNQAGAHQRARFNDRLPCERNGTSDSSLSRATTSTRRRCR